MALILCRASQAWKESWKYWLAPPISAQLGAGATQSLVGTGAEGAERSAVIDSYCVLRLADQEVRNQWTGL